MVWYIGRGLDKDTSIFFNRRKIGSTISPGFSTLSSKSISASLLVETVQTPLSQI
ncbi:uncharacterized protein BT62DRAFT_930861 [Guyanagaster necrorhizus]|uniref:Uncharacterized protein n=1 Tax=Guyanagaster necrorhizus TaxID=856835 RepID=A0A9P8AU99_9AGAR|nr:uncharacterized protein BT62DRAFT_930861 [Guyanagaster necrorhizus MCA 3950]KAG7447816.1 hypothetical protein BT62DRAFT_930861 [Guyanagaster necrorhizus MCA 3950]